MTDLAADAAAAPSGVIATDDERYNASLVRRVDQHESLGYFWVRFDAEPTPFESGQYMTIGVFVDGKIVQRPYSVASRRTSPARPGYEFYLRLVQGGTFTPLLWDLPVGHRMRMIGPKGKFLLEPDDDRTHLFISSGTGNAPFVAMMRDTLAAGAPRRDGLPERCLLRGRPRLPRRARGLGGRRRVSRSRTSRPSRAPTTPNAGWAGRTGRVEAIVAPVFEELGLRPDDTIAYLCGNPDMIISAEADAARARSAGDGDQEGAVLAERQGTARRRRRCGRGRSRRRRVIATGRDAASLPHSPGGSTTRAAPPGP